MVLYCYHVLKPKPQNLAEESDSSEDEAGRETVNRIGDVPLWWYDDYDHIGYDADGKRIMKKTGPKEDSIDKLVSRADDPMAR